MLNQLQTLKNLQDNTKCTKMFEARTKRSMSSHRFLTEERKKMAVGRLNPSFFFPARVEAGSGLGPLQSNGELADLRCDSGGRRASSDEEANASDWAGDRDISCSRRSPK